MFFDLGIRCIDEHGREVLDVLCEAFRLMSIRSRYHNVVSVTLRESVPFLVAEYVVVQLVKGLQMFLEK